ncbi:MAG TPA: hypothetical protein VEL31_02470 [Ktedonobacteraceae bacterium]|nr:hypothetical protein [Ktedonobacteraceae bacterium]
MRLKDLFQVQTVSGLPVTVDSITVTPQSQALIVRFPQSAFVRSRPTAVLVERNGQVERLPIVDLTHITQLRLVGLSVVVITIVSLVRFARRKEKVS